jgi:zinc-binding alcohol dehydrogenase/oxidoreductase
MGNDAEFSAMLAAVASGRLDPVVDEVYPLADVLHGYERLEKGDGFGKIVFRIP